MENEEERQLELLKRQDENDRKLVARAASHQSRVNPGHAATSAPSSIRLQLRAEAISQVAASNNHMVTTVFEHVRVENEKERQLELLKRQDENDRKLVARAASHQSRVNPGHAATLTPSSICLQLSAGAISQVAAAYNHMVTTVFEHVRVENEKERQLHVELLKRQDENGEL